MSCLELDDAEIIRIAEPMMDDVMVGIARRDYQLHSQQFSVDLKSRITPEHFLETCTQQEQDWGRPQARELVTIFRKPRSFTLIWNQHFERAEGQVLALATIALKGGRYFVDCFFLH